MVSGTLLGTLGIFGQSTICETFGTFRKAQKKRSSAKTAGVIISTYNTRNEKDSTLFSTKGSKPLGTWMSNMWHWVIAQTLRKTQQWPHKDRYTTTCTQGGFWWQQHDNINGWECAKNALIYSLIERLERPDSWQMCPCGATVKCLRVAREERRKILRFRIHFVLKHPLTRAPNGASNARPVRPI